MFTRCRNTATGGEADLATGALDMWATLGWEPIKDPVPTPRGRKAAEKSDGETATTDKE